jgi:hypothetical protein
MRQKLPQSSPPVDNAAVPASAINRSTQGFIGTADSISSLSGMQANSLSGMQATSLSDGQGNSLSGRQANSVMSQGSGASRGASDHELSRAVFGNSSQSNSSQSSNRVVSGSGVQNSEAVRSVQPDSHVNSAFPVKPIASQEMRVAGAENGAKTETGPQNETGVGSVQLSLLEFRRLIAGGLPNPATRVFVVTGRGLAGPIRITQITQVIRLKCVPAASLLFSMLCS